ncbi:hypothetical protein DFP83_1095 [Idiomarina fontislapidosi]|uniref:Uncharacterized protein n=1 Tax=Idiomarina fontislapidosi TaxID=263723 RepID=A0A432XTU6_9GAMM|nr:hypothetical protein [Idiomarina fontislapidosi]PYE31505.1 hypothetical protein DFP83_1095 [Idiomarina fontislapidosi]RUO52140.1 hypothetical protein CWE25_09670 [Idiomarina fontislapidosi]
MSNSLFRKDAYGLYHYFEQIIEIRNDILNLNHARAQEIVTSKGLAAVTDEEIEFYKTYIHESVHFIDSTSTLWGMEYTCRLYNCFNSNNSKEAIEVFLVNDSEIEQHAHSRIPTTTAFIEYRTMRSILSYNPRYGAYINFKYYSHDGNRFSEVFSTPLTMLALLEGHAYAQELLTALALFKSKDDPISTHLLKKEYEKTLIDTALSEYTCILSFTEQLFDVYKFEERLSIVVLACRFVLDLPDLFPFPQAYIDSCFSNNTDEQIISAFKMELNRGMNRSSLVAIILILLHCSLEAKPINTSSYEFSTELENRIFELFAKEGESVESCKQTFKTLHDISYETSLNLLHEKGAELAYLSALANKDRDWLSFNPTEVALPCVLLTTGEFLSANHELDYDIKKLVFSDDEKASELTKRLKQEKVRKPHLRPTVCHDWLKKIESGEIGVHYYPEDF